MKFPFQDQVRWTRSQVVGTQELIVGELKDVEAREGVEAVRAYLQHAIGALEEDLDPVAQLRRFLFVLSLLTQHERHGWLTGPEVTRLVEVGEAILRTQGIHPGTSKLSFLYSDLYLAWSHIQRRGGEHWRAAWRSQIAQSLSKGDERGPAHHALTTAIHAHRFGNLALALEAYNVSESSGLGGDLLERARVGRIQALRLAGRLSEASTLATETMATMKVSEAADLELHWEGLCREAQATGDVTAIVNAVGRGHAHRHSTYMLEATLWAKAAGSRKWLDWVPKAESIRKLFPDTLRRNSPNAFFYECALQLDRCYDNQIPLQNRLTALGELLEDAHRLPTLDKELLLWAAAARWLVRYHQYGMAALVLAEYRALSLRCTDGLVPDCLGLTSDLDVKTWLRFDAAAREAADGERRVASKIKSSRLARAADVTMMTAKVGGVILKNKVKRIGAEPEAIQTMRDEEIAEICEIFVESATKLKGPVAKVAQLLSLGVGSMKPRTRERLATIRDRMEPISSASVRQVIEAELGRPVAELFRDFSDEPLSAASIGQIHRATTLDGKDVIVKVQYPGIREAIAADFRNLHLARPIIRSIFPKANIEEVEAVSMRHLLDECDYRREAECQTLVAKTFHDDPEILVPAIHDALTTAKVLTMDYVSGLRFDDFVRIASQEEKNRAAATLYRYAWSSVLQHGLLNGDPHPGNFLFLSEGRVAPLDFGYFCRYPEERIEALKRLFKAMIENDYPAFRVQFDKLGYVVPDVDVDYQAIWETARQMSLAMRSTVPCRFSQHKISQTFEHATFRSVNRAALRLPVDDAMLVRFSWCLQSLFSLMDAEVLWRSLIWPMLYGKDWDGAVDKVG